MAQIRSILNMWLTWEDFGSSMNREPPRSPVLIGGFFKNRADRFGASIIFGILVLEGLSARFPFVGNLPIIRDLGLGSVFGPPLGFHLGMTISHTKALL